MKKHLLFCLLFVLLAINARAQLNTTVTIGTGTINSADFGPLFISQVAGGHTSQHAALYSASEINATSFAGKVLTKIAWNKTDTSRYNKNNGIIKIYVKQTTATTITSNFFGEANVANEIAGATLVYTNNTQNISAGPGWKEFTLQTPFMWNGNSNLEIVVDWSHPGVSTGPVPMEWATTAITTNISAFFKDAFQLGIITMQSKRPNVQLTFTEYSNEAGISSITAPAAITAPGANQVAATVKNFGNNPLTTATIGWKVNGLTQPDISWTGNLPAGQTAGTSTLGNFTFPFGASTIKVYTKNPNGVNDPFKNNDTTTIKVIGCTALSGNYTIDKNAPASATNTVRSFTEAAQVLSSCGVSGPVTFTVAPGSGPYNEAFELKNVTGTSAVNTITFEGNANILTAELPTSTSAAIKIDNVKYLKLNNLVVTANSVLTQGYGIQFLNQSHFATVSNCTVNMPAIFGQNFVGLLIGTTHNGSGDNSSNSLFENNIVTGGGFSMRINGLAVTGSSPIGAVNVRVIGNQFKDFGNNGIYTNNTDGSKIEGNTFTRPTRTDAGAFAGITLGSGTRSTIVNKNRFFNTHGGATSKTTGVTGIDVQAVAPVGAENLVKNNVFYDLNNTGVITALTTFTTTTEGVYFYHNSISLDCPGRPATNTSTLKAFNLAGTGVNIKFINNVVTINSLGTGIKAAMYFAGATAATFVSNNNVFYVAPGQTTAYVGYVVAPAPIKTAATLTAWQAINPTGPYDANSVEVNPAFTDLITGNLKPTAAGVNNLGVPVTPAVTDDIAGVTRNLTTPDQGAYELVDDAGITAITTPNSGCNLTNAEVVTVTIKNFGEVPLTNVPVSYTINGGTAVNETYAGSIAPNATANYAFTATANLAAPGSYSIVATANLTADDLATNNSFTKVVVASAPAAVPAITAGGPVSICTGSSVVLTAASTTTGATYAWYLNGTAITGATSATYTANAAGSYTAIATANGCPSAASAATTITVNAIPVIPVITNSGSTTFCTGGSVTLTAASTTTGSSYAWYRNGTAIAGATSAVYTAGIAGSYTVIATANGCSSAYSAVTAVTVNATPATPTISQAGFVLTSSSTTGNQWYLNGTPITGATNATYTSTANGTYTLMVTTNGCNSAVSAAVTIINTGITDDQNIAIAVYPNPSSGLVNVTLPKGQVYEMEVTDMTGKVILTQKITTDITQVNLSKAAKGIYLLKVTGENGMAVRKLIVE